MSKLSTLQILSRLSLCIAFSFCCVSGGAQPGFGIEFSSLTGKIIRHSSKFTSPIPSISMAFDASFVWQTYGKQDWEQRRNFPVVGAGITYTDYGNNKVYGRCVGAYPFLQIPLIRGRRMEWTFRFGDGLGYVTRKHTATSDTMNAAISTNVNDFAMFMTDIRFQANDHWQFQVGANFTHISNADYSQPNLGVNMAGMHVGVRFFPATCRPKIIVRELPKLTNRWLAELRLSTSYKEARAAGNPILPSYLAAVYVSRRWLGKNKYFFGADYAYHNDVYAFLKNCNIYGDRNQKAYSWDGAVFLGNEFLVGRVGLITQLGIYYHQTFLKFDPVYQKIGGHYYIVRNEKGSLKELFISGLLLTHQIRAELAEFGIGAGF